MNQDKTFFFLIVRKDTCDEMYPVYLSESYALSQSQLAIMQNAASNAPGERFHLQAFVNGKPCPLEDALILLPSTPNENEGTAPSPDDAGCAYLVCSGITGGSYVPHHVCKNHALAQDVLKGLMQDDLDKMPCHPNSGSSRQYYPDSDTDFWVDSLSGQAGAKFFAILRFQAGYLVPWLDDASFWYESHR